MGAQATGVPPLASEVTRRVFLRGLSAAGVAAAAAAGVAPLTASAMTGDQTPLRLRRWAMVIDLRRCDGCVGLGLPPQCTQACNWARFVPGDQHWIEVFDPDPHAGVETGAFPLPCMQCQNAPCVNVCPVGATFHTPSGTVLIDQTRCVGCRLCMAACPYDRRFFNWGDPDQPDWIREYPYDVRTQVPAFRGTVMKCDFCADQTSEGGLPFCVTACPRGAIYMGDVEEDIAANGSEVVMLSHLLHEGNATRYKEDLGTEPRVYYLPGHGELAGETGGPVLRGQLEWLASSPPQEHADGDADAS